MLPTRPVQVLPGGTTGSATRLPCSLHVDGGLVAALVSEEAVTVALHHWLGIGETAGLEGGDKPVPVDSADADLRSGADATGMPLSAVPATPTPARKAAAAPAKEASPQPAPSSGAGVSTSGAAKAGVPVHHHPITSGDGAGKKQAGAIKRKPTGSQPSSDEGDEGSHAPKSNSKTPQRKKSKRHPQPGGGAGFRV